MEQSAFRVFLSSLWLERLEIAAWLGVVLSQLATGGLIENAKVQGWVSFTASALVAAVVRGNKIKANRDAKAPEQD